MESFRDLQSFSVTCGGREAPCGNRWGSGDTWLFGHLVQTRNLGGVEGKEYTYDALAQLKKKKPKKEHLSDQTGQPTIIVVRVKKSATPSSAHMAKF